MRNVQMQFQQQQRLRFRHALVFLHTYLFCIETLPLFHSCQLSRNLVDSHSVLLTASYQKGDHHINRDGRKKTVALRWYKVSPDQACTWIELVRRHRIGRREEVSERLSTPGRPAWYTGRQFHRAFRAVGACREGCCVSKTRSARIMLADDPAVFTYVAPEVERPMTVAAI